MTRLHMFQKGANIVAYLLFLFMTIYTIVDNGPGSKNEARPTSISPSHWISCIWILIHTLLGGFVIYQWFGSAHEAVIHGVGWNFVISAILSNVWLGLLKTGHYITGFVFVFLTCFSLSYVFYKLTKEHPASTWTDKIFIHAPFSVWHGWFVFSTVLNFFQAFVSSEKNLSITWTRVLSIFAFIFLTFTAISYVEYKKYRGDITGSVVIGAGLLAIFTHHHDQWIHWSALVAAIITLIYPSRPYIFKLVGHSSDSENTPFLT